MQQITTPHTQKKTHAPAKSIDNDMDNKNGFGMLAAVRSISSEYHVLQVTRRFYLSLNMDTELITLNENSLNLKKTVIQKKNLSSASLILYNTKKIFFRKIVNKTAIA